MNKEEFLQRLEELLCAIPQEERIDALAFYRSYFEDAGEENEAKVIEELGSPENVFKSIMETYSCSGKYAGTYDEDVSGGKKSYKTTAIVLGVILAVLTCPVWGSILIALFGVMIGIIGVAIGLLAAAAAVMIALFAAGVSLLVAGLLALIATPVTGIGLVAGGLILLGVALLALVLVVWMFGSLLPWIFRKISVAAKKLLSWIKSKKRG